MQPVARPKLQRDAMREEQASARRCCRTLIDRSTCEPSRDRIEGDEHQHDNGVCNNKRQNDSGVRDHVVSINMLHGDDPARPSS